MSDVPSVEALLGRIATVAGRDVTWAPLPGGLSHHIYLVDAVAAPGAPASAGADRYVLRVLQPAVSAAGLGIPPETEVENTLAAARTGIGARVVEVLPDVPALLLEFLPGRTLGAADVRDPALAEPIATACRALHAGERFGNDFDIFAKRAELLALCARHDLPVPDGYHDHDDAVGRLRQALAATALPSVPCHNDLLPENFIQTPDGRVRIIDYQLAGNNDPAFELGDIAAEADFDPDQAGRLAAQYFGPEHNDALTARVRLNLIASNVTWTLWFAVHCGLVAPVSAGAAGTTGATGADSGFDYAGEAADKWGQAVRDLTAPDFGRLLDTAAGRRPATYPT